MKTTNLRPIFKNFLLGGLQIAATTLTASTIVFSSSAFANVDINGGFHSEVFYSTLEKDSNITFSDLWGQVHFGDGASFNEITEEGAEVGTYAFRVSIKISGLPTLLRDSTEDELNETITHSVMALVEESMAANEALAGFPPSVTDPIRDDLVAQIMQMKSQIVHERLDQIQLETTFQDFSVGAAWQLTENTRVYGSMGKEQIHSNFIESKTVALDPNTALLAGGTAGTGFVKFGHISELEGGGTVQTELIIFKTRAPWKDAKSYIGKVVNMDEKSFENHKEWEKLDSGMVKVMYSNGHYYVSASVARHANLKPGEKEIYEATIDAAWEMGHHKFALSGYFGDQKRSGVDNALSFDYDYHWGHRLTLYSGVHWYDNYDNPMTPDKEHKNFQSVLLGAKYKLFETKHCQLSVNAQGKKYFGYHHDDYDLSVGANGGCQW